MVSEVVRANFGSYPTPALGSALGRSGSSAQRFAPANDALVLDHDLIDGNQAEGRASTRAWTARWRAPTPPPSSALTARRQVRRFLAKFSWRFPAGELTLGSMLLKVVLRVAVWAVAVVIGLTAIVGPLLSIVLMVGAASAWGLAMLIATPIVAFCGLLIIVRMNRLRQRLP